MRAIDLLNQFIGDDDFGPVEDFVLSALPTASYESISLNDLNPDNPKGFDLTGAIVWYPSGTLKTLQRCRFQILSHSPNCTIYFLQHAPSMLIKLNGPGHSLLNLTRNKMAMKLRMTGGAGDHLKGCKVLIGENSFAGGIDAILLNTDFIIKKQSLWSDGILVQGSNQHGIVDRSSMEPIDYGRNRIILEPHVWIGRRAVLTSGAHIGGGSVVGTSAVATKAYPPSCIIAGNPGRVIKRNMTWSNSLVDIGDSERDIIDQYAMLIPDEPPPSMKDKALTAIQSVWVKALAAGAAGAAAFEGLQNAVMALG